VRQHIRRLLCCLLAALALLGCGRGDAVELSRWSLVSGDGAVDVVLPARLDLPAGAYVLRTQVTIPPHLAGRPVTLAVPLFYGRAALVADGIEAQAAVEDVEGGYRATGPQLWRIPSEATDDGKLELELRVDHRWTQSGWHGAVPRLAAEPHGDRGFRIRSAVSMLGAWGALAALLTVGLTYFAVFLFDRRHTAHGWFALATFAATAYPLFNLGLTQAVGTLDVPILGTAIAVALVATIRFTHAEFGLGRAPVAILALPLVVALPAPFCAGPFVATQCLAPLALGTVAFALCYELVFLWRLIRRTPSDVNARIVFACWVLLGASLVNDARAWLGFGEWLGGVRTGGIGLLLFALLQSIALSRQHILAFRRVDALNAELAARVAQLEGRQREVALLGDELRRQLGERSRDLAAVLASFGRGSGPRTELVAGALVANRYRVERELGAGGMGKVYEVQRLADGRRLAIKVLRGRVNAAQAARFAREAQLISGLDHPNVVGIADVGVAPEGFLFLVMAYVDGCSLRQVADRFGDVAWAMPVLRQLADALAVIHRHGIVHRDVKPGNVLISGSDAKPLVQLTDFGIATIAGGEDDPAISERGVAPPAADAVLGETSARSRTETGVVLGTPLYMAPELSFGARDATPAADVFAFGVIAYELLTGLRPFFEPPVTALYRDGYAPPARPCPGVPARVADVLRRCLATDPAARPTAATLAAQLREDREPWQQSAH
jgi:hypothetical protein